MVVSDSSFAICELTRIAFTGTTLTKVRVRVAKLKYLVLLPVPPIMRVLGCSMGGACVSSSKQRQAGWRFVGCLCLCFLLRFPRVADFQFLPCDFLRFYLIFVIPRIFFTAFNSLQSFFLQIFLKCHPKRHSPPCRTLPARQNFFHLLNLRPLFGRDHSRP